MSSDTHRSVLDALFPNFTGQLVYHAAGTSHTGTLADAIAAQCSHVSTVPGAMIPFVHATVDGMSGEDALNTRLPAGVILRNEADDAVVLIWLLDDPATIAKTQQMLGNGYMCAWGTSVPVPPADGWQVFRCDPAMRVTLEELNAEYNEGAVETFHDVGSTFADAIVMSPFDETAPQYAQELVVSLGPNKEAKRWRPQAIPVGGLLALLSQHKEGKKDGPAIVLGDMIPGQRLKKTVKALYAIGLDVDTGTPSSVIDAAIAKLGCAAVRYTTHSHNKTSDEFIKDRVIKFNNGDDDINVDVLKRFLREVEHWAEPIIESVEYIGDAHTKKGIVETISFDPMPKNRIIVPLASPFEIAKEAKTQAEAMAKWAKVLEALAAKLGVPFDRSCTDPSRLFYTPRHAKGKPFEIRLWGGPLFDSKTLELEGMFDNIDVNINKGKSKSKTNEGRELGRWSIKRAHGFQIRDVIEAYAPDRIRGRASSNGITIECPFDEEHSNAGDHTDAGCFAVNAGDGSSEIFTISCRHESCHGRTNLDNLGKMLKDKWFEADVLESDDFNAEILEDEPSEPEPASEADIETMIAALNKESSAEEITSVIAAVIQLKNAVAVERARKKIATATGMTLTAIKELMKEERKKFAAAQEPPRNAKNGNGVDLGLFPFPPSTLGSGFHYLKVDGRPWLHRSERSADGEVSKIRLFTPLSISAGVVYRDRGNARGLRVTLLNEDGQVHAMDLPAGLAIRSFGTELRVALKENGVAFTEDGEKLLVRYFNESAPADPIEIYTRPGWRDGIFITPWGRQIGGNRRAELAADMRPPGVETSGSLEGWKAAIATSMHTGYLLFQIGPLTGFASPLLELAGYASMALGYTGASTRGKSTAQRVQASCWGDTKPKQGLFGTFHGTARASERIAERGSGAGVAFDEAHSLPGKELQNFLFAISSNSGADRLNRNADLVAAREFCVFLTFSSELSVAEKLRTDGVRPVTGLTTRVLELNVDDQPDLPAETIRAILAAYDNVGHAGPEFVRAVIAAGYVSNPERLVSEIEAKVDALCGGGSAAERRAANIAAVLWQAGCIAKDAGLIPHDIDVEDIAKRLWAKAMEADIAASKPTEAAIQTLLENLITRKGGDVSEGTSSDTRNSLGYWIENFKGGREAVYVVPLKNLSELSGATIGTKKLSHELAERGMLLLPNRTGQNAWDYVPGLGKLRSLIIPASVVEDQSDATDKGD